MKRSWFGLVLLLVLLAGGLLVAWGMSRIHDPIAADLEQAAECALLGDWLNANVFSRKAVAAWEKWEHFRACFADHTPAEEISAEIAEMEVYRTAEENVAFAASCAELAQKIEAIGEAHGLFWWNVL